MRRTSAVFFFLLLTVFVKGQVLKSVGINEGVSIANQTWHYKPIDLTLNNVSKVGFYSGAVFEFFQSKYCNLLVDFGYCQKGNSLKIPSTTSNLPEGDGTYTTFKTSFNYLTLSPMLKAGYETTQFVPYVLLGFRMDYQLSIQSDLSYEVLENKINKIILGTNFGAGAEYKMKHIGIFFEGQYQYDFSKVVNTPSSGNSWGLEVKNKAFIIGIGMKYYLKKKEDTK